VRLSRARFYEVDGADNRAAFATLHEVLVVVSRLLAPFAPFVSDWLHRELVGTSVHLASFVRADADAPDAELERAMDAVRTLANLGRSAREDANLRVRQPLAHLVCVVPQAVERGVRELAPLLEAELNVKRVDFASSADALVTLEAKANFRALGRKFGKSTPLAAQAVNALGAESLRAFERGEPLFISVDGVEHAIDAEELSIVRRASGDLAVAEGGGYFAAVDRTVTPELRREGIARELVSRVQRLRKESGLDVSDRVRLWLGGSPDVEEAARAHQSWIADEVLARTIDVGGEPPAHYTVTFADDLDGLAARAALAKD
jgi:isoleucyl-tRNA synthetase